MKTLLLFLLLPVLCKAQKNLDSDTLKLTSGYQFVKGDDLNLGVGSNASTKGFNFIYTSPVSMMASKIELGAGWAGMKMKIDGFKLYHGKKTGDKYYIVLRGGNIVKYWCDIEPAIQAKEVIVTGNEDRPTPSGSVADKLKKLKDLLDSGALTQDEYDAAKKKLIEKM